MAEIFVKPDENFKNLLNGIAKAVEDGGGETSENIFVFNCDFSYDEDTVYFPNEDDPVVTKYKNGLLSVSIDSIIEAINSGKAILVNVRTFYDGDLDGSTTLTPNILWYTDTSQSGPIEHITLEGCFENNSGLFCKLYINIVPGESTPFRSDFVYICDSCNNIVIDVTFGNEEGQVSKTDLNTACQMISDLPNLLTNKINLIDSVNEMIFKFEPETDGYAFTNIRADITHFYVEQYHLLNDGMDHVLQTISYDPGDK